MRLNFKTLKIHNFKSFLDQEFDFSSMSGMTLVCGKNHDIPGQANSAGKSSIFDALLYALFGQLQTNVKNKNLKNRYSNDSSMVVSIDFDVDGKNSYRIERGLNKYGQTFLRVYNGENKEISKSSIQESDAFISNEILRCDVSIFLRTVLLSSDQNYNFFLLPPAMKKDFIEKLFNIKIFGEMYSLIHRDILDADKEFAKKQSAILLLNKNKDDLEERKEDFEKDRKTEISSLETKKKEIEDKLEELESKKISVNEEELAKYEDALNKLSEKRIETNNGIRDLSEKERNLYSKKVKLETGKKSSEKTISSYSGLLEKLCDHCKPVVSKYYNLDKMNAQIEEAEKKLSTLEDESASLKNESSKLNEKIVKIDSKTEIINKKIHELTDESNKVRIEIGKLQHEISFQEKELEKRKTEKNPYVELLSNAETNISKENEELADLNNRYNYLKFAEQIVSQDTLKKFIIKDLVGLLNSKIKFYLMKLGAKYTCVFDESMKFTFITPDNGGETEYATFSAGERMRLLIAASFAFRDFMSTRNNFTSNILILDEFIDSAIDTLAVNNVLQILQEFSRLNKQHVLIISHRKEIDNSIFDNIVMVEKTRNISTISILPPEK